MARIQETRGEAVNDICENTGYLFSLFNRALGVAFICLLVLTAFRAAYIAGHLAHDQERGAYRAGGER